MHALVQRVDQFLSRFDCSAGLVVAVSGGPDSVALLRLLLALPVPRDLVVAHLNHQLRGAHSDADEMFVRRLHAALAPAASARFELRYEKINIADRARAESDNLEQVARTARYDWLGRVARESGVPLVATGHTADDQAETVLHRLMRGAGLRGLRGIAPRRPLAPGAELMRPLLGTTRTELRAYLAEVGQEYCLDRSNFDLRLTRNRIRHELLPFLAAHFNPAIAAVLCRLAEQADDVYREVEAGGHRLLGEAEHARAGPVVVLDRAVLAAAPRNLVRELFRLLWDREEWPMNAMDFAAWDRLAEVAFGRLPSVDLPGGIRACGRARVVQVGPAS